MRADSSLNAHTLWCTCNPVQCTVPHVPQDCATSATHSPTRSTGLCNQCNTQSTHVPQDCATSATHSPTRSTGLCSQCNTQSHTFHRTVQPVQHTVHTRSTRLQPNTESDPFHRTTQLMHSPTRPRIMYNPTQSHTSQDNVQPNTQSHTSQENVQSSHVPGICTIIANRFPEAHKGDAMEHNPFRHVQAALQPIGAIDRSPVRHVQAVVCRYKERQCSDRFRQ